MTIEYLSGQIDAGAEGVQLFDSWSGSLSPAQFERWVIGPNARIAAAVRERYPHVPVIGFPKGAGAKLAAYARETGVDAVGIDETQDPRWIAATLPADLPVQGNLDPLALIAGGEALEHAVANILSPSRTARTSSTWATASCQTRRSRMSSGCWSWCAGPTGEFELGLADGDGSALPLD
jgi:uroporphyrinogen decarboxylase